MSPAILVAQPSWPDNVFWDVAWWIVMGLGMIVFWTAVVVGVVFVVRELTRARGVREAESDPLAILDRRLATGEISIDEHRERRSVLRGERRPAGED